MMLQLIFCVNYLLSFCIILAALCAFVYLNLVATPLMEPILHIFYIQELCQKFKTIHPTTILSNTQTASQVAYQFIRNIALNKNKRYRYSKTQRRYRIKFLEKKK